MGSVTHIQVNVAVASRDIPVNTVQLVCLFIQNRATIVDALPNLQKSCFDILFRLQTYHLL